jgi:hypothetical protein
MPTNRAECHALPLAAHSIQWAHDNGRTLA